MNDGRSISYSSNGSAASASSEEPGASPVTSPAMELPPQDIVDLLCYSLGTARADCECCHCAEPDGFTGRLHNVRFDVWGR